MQRTVDGNASLQDQENTLNFAERVAVVKLVSYLRAVPAPVATPAPGAPPPTETHHTNMATFEDRDIASTISPLSLIEVAAGQTVAGTAGQHPGKEIVFASDIWVSGVIKKVVGLR